MAIVGQAIKQGSTLQMKRCSAILKPSVPAGSRTGGPDIEAEAEAGAGAGGRELWEAERPRPVTRTHPKGPPFDQDTDWSGAP